MIGIRHWLVAGLLAVGLHGAVLGLAMSSPEVEMERSAGRPGAVWGLPVETIADVVDIAPTGGSEQVEATEPTEVDVSETVEAVEPTESTDVVEAVETAEAAPPEPVETAQVETAEEIEEVEPVEALAEVRYAALTPAAETEIIVAEDVGTPLPPVRPADVPRIAAPPKPKVAKTTPPAPQKSQKPQKKTAAAPAPARPAPAGPGNPSPSAAPAGEQVGSAGKRQADSGRHLVSSYAGRVAAHLQRHKRYPKEAADRRLSGTATITFTIGADGRVRSAKLARSSGTGAFDTEVVAMVGRAAPFPPIPPSIGKSVMTFTVPVRFKPR